MNTGDTSIKSDYIRILFEQGFRVYYIQSTLCTYYHFIGKKTFIAIFVYFLMLGILGDTMSLFYRYIFIYGILSISHRNIEERSEKKKILFIATRNFYPTDSGDKLHSRCCKENFS